MGRKKTDGEKYQPNRKPELRIQGVSERTKNILKNIAAHEIGNGSGNFSEFMRPHLMKIAEQYPKHKWEPPLDY